jgi:hypothetical protein
MGGCVCSDDIKSRQKSPGPLALRHCASHPVPAGLVCPRLGLCHRRTRDKEKGCRNRSRQQQPRPSLSLRQNYPSLPAPPRLRRSLVVCHGLRIAYLASTNELHNLPFLAARHSEGKGPGRILRGNVFRTFGAVHTIASEPGSEFTCRGHPTLGLESHRPCPVETKVERGRLTRGACREPQVVAAWARGRPQARDICL